MYQILSSGVREIGPREKGKFLLGEEAWKTLSRLRWVVWPAGMMLPRFGRCSNPLLGLRADAM